MQLSPMPIFSSLPVTAWADNIHMRELAILVVSLYPFLGRLNPTAHPPVHRAFLRLVASDTDKLLPFRDLGTSRQRVLKDGGPYSSNNLHTRSGFFSALIYRGVTHNTKFLLEQKTLYNDLDDWDRQYQQLSKVHGPEYFCNKSAYGVPIKLRAVKNVPAYWKLSGEVKYNSWLIGRNRTGCSFTDFVKKIKDSTRFVGFGWLTAFLLAADYAKVGCLPMPSVLEVGVLVHKLNAGGKVGLMKLGFSCIDEEDTTKAFLAVFDALYELVPQERKKEIGFDVFFVEHTLCKFCRLAKSRLFKNLCREVEKTAARPLELSA
jgi:hypothetical protein